MINKYTDRKVIFILIISIILSFIPLNALAQYKYIPKINYDENNYTISVTDAEPKGKYTIVVREDITPTNKTEYYLVDEGEISENGTLIIKLKNTKFYRDMNAKIILNINGALFDEDIFLKKNSEKEDDEKNKYENELRLIIDTGERRDSINHKIGFNKGETVRTVTERAIDEIGKDDKDLRFTFTRDGNLTSYETRREIYKNDTKTGYKWILTIDRREPRNNPRIEKLDERTRDITWSYEEIKEKEDNKKEDEKKEEEKIEENDSKEKPAIDKDGNPTGNLLDKTSKTPYITGYKDQSFRPTRNAKREEVAAMIYKVIDDKVIAENRSKNINFIDVPDYKWSLEYIATLSNMNLINGYKDGTFRPGNTITRGETVAIVARATNVDEKPGSVFIDTNGHWAENLINGVADQGWLNGYKDGTFRPNDPITRAELVTVLNNALERPNKIGSPKRFTDVSTFNWYYDEVMKASSF